MSENWTQEEAIEMCRHIEAVCPPCGCHVALTGGLLYKTGERKDCDILFYRIRQRKKIDYDALWNVLASIGIVKDSGFGWCFKAKRNGKKIDIFMPEEQQGEYLCSECNLPVANGCKCIADKPEFNP